MSRGKNKNISNRNQGYLASSKPSCPTITSPGYPITQEKEDSVLTLLVIMMLEDFKKDISNSLEENTGEHRKTGRIP